MCHYYDKCICVKFLLDRCTRDIICPFRLNLLRSLIFIEIYNLKLIEGFIFPLMSIDYYKKRLPSM